MVSDAASLPYDADAANPADIENKNISIKAQAPTLQSLSFTFILYLQWQLTNVSLELFSSLLCSTSELATIEFPPFPNPLTLYSKNEESQAKSCASISR